MCIKTLTSVTKKDVDFSQKNLLSFPCTENMERLSILEKIYTSFKHVLNKD